MGSCTTPSSITGYGNAGATETALKISGFAVTGYTCASGYSGTAAASVCTGGAGSDLDEVKSMKKPPNKVKITLEVICLMLGLEPKQVSDPNDLSIKYLGKKDNFFFAEEELRLIFPT